MKILVLSDIHANQFALERVLKQVKDNYQTIWILGDLVGYGANPVEVYEKIREACSRSGKQCVWLGGNHERTLEKDDIENLSKTEQVDKRHLDELFSSIEESKPHFTTILAEEEQRRSGLDISDWVFFLVHSSYAEPKNDDRYLFPWLEREEYTKLFQQEFYALPGDRLQSRCMLYGHTHVPTLVKAQQKTEGNLELKAEKIIPFVSYPLDKECTWFINPGSVGLPSDNDIRASYAVIELSSEGTVSVTFYRIDYEIQDALDAMGSKKYSFIHYGQGYRHRLINAPAHDHTPRPWLEHYDAAKQITSKPLESQE